MEIWKDVMGFEGFYKISNYGKIKTLERVVDMPNGGTRLDKSKLLKCRDTPNGYKMVKLMARGKVKDISVHRLVGEHFIDNPNNKLTINHIDGVKHNNKYDNLEWATQSENILHSLHILGNINTVNKSKRKIVQLLDECGNCFREHIGIRNCAKIEKVSTATIYQYDKSGEKYNGVYWRILK